MRIVAMLILTAVLAPAQFRAIEVHFEGIGCATCIESLPARLQRLRGVTSAQVDTQKQILKVELASTNRVRVEQVRDALEQDGTKTINAIVQVGGELSSSAGKWILKPPGVPTTYEVTGAVPSNLEPGKYLVTGRILKLRSDRGPLNIEATDLEREPGP